MGWKECSGGANYVRRGVVIGETVDEAVGPACAYLADAAHFSRLWMWDKKTTNIATVH